MAYHHHSSLPGDITQKSEVARLAQEVGDREAKGIHLLVNNV
jgi:NAD(P)-dependent dehydrogenase (short-subunit alcohol dehydrogenase family)